MTLGEMIGKTIMCSLAANLGPWVTSQGTPQVLYATKFPTPIKSMQKAH